MSITIIRGVLKTEILAMSDQILHEDGSEYPLHFASAQKLTKAIALHLSPYVLGKNEVLRRKDIFARLDQYHCNLTSNHFDGQWAGWGRIMKSVVGDTSWFEAVEGHGLYKYIGPTNEERYSFDEISLDENIQNDTLEYTADETLVSTAVGNESLYVWWHIDSEDLAKLRSNNEWAMKIGRHNSPNVGTRFAQYRVAIPHNIRLGLVVACENAAVLEKAVHVPLTNRGKKIDEEGNEWYVTNVQEVKEILRFHTLI